jgi:hypothetical protein
MVDDVWALTRHRAGATQGFKYFVGRASAAVLYVFEALADSFRGVGLCSEVEELLVGFSVLHCHLALRLIARIEERFFLVSDMSTSKLL